MEMSFREWLVILFAACALALPTVHLQVRQVGGFDFIDGEQVKRHRNVLQHKAGNPWSYRQLSDRAVRGVVRLFEALKIRKAQRYGFIAFRLGQNALIFVLAWLYFRRIGLRRYLVALGVGLVAWAMTQSSWASDLDFDTYTDLIMFLVAGILLIRRERPLWLVPLAVIAVLNRETGGLIALLLLGLAWSKGLRSPAGQRLVATAAATALAAALTLGVVRGLIESRGPSPLPQGHRPGLDLFTFNLRHLQGWVNLFATFNVIPLLALVSFHRWPKELKGFGLALVPIWLFFHMVFGAMEETRLFLVPFVLIAVPGALVAVAGRERTGPTASESATALKPV